MQINLLTAGSLPVPESALVEVEYFISGVWRNRKVAIADLVTSGSVSGTANRLVKYHSSGTSLADSGIEDDGTNISADLNSRSGSQVNISTQVGFYASGQIGSNYGNIAATYASCAMQCGDGTDTGYVGVTKDDVIVLSSQISNGGIAQIKDNGFGGTALRTSLVVNSLATPANNFDFDNQTINQSSNVVVDFVNGSLAKTSGGITYNFKTGIQYDNSGGVAHNHFSRILNDQFDDTVLDYDASVLWAGSGSIERFNWETGDFKNDAGDVITMAQLSVLGDAAQAGNTGYHLVTDGAGALSWAIPSAVVGAMVFQSAWNASTNTSPTLASGVGTKGYYYIVTVAGSTSLDGINSWSVGDWAVYDGTAWIKVDNTDAISSFNGRTGAITLSSGDVTTALSFTPYNSTNPSNYISAATTDTFTNKTYDTAATGNVFSINGLAANANTGTGAVVRATSPTLVSPALGTPSAAILTNATGLPVATGISGLGSGVATMLATFSSANILAACTDETGTGSLVFGTAPTFTTSIQVGSGTTGCKLQSDGGTYSAFFNASVTPAAGNYFIKNNGSTTLLNASTGGALYLAFNGSGLLSISGSTAITVADAVNLAFGSTTGTKIGGTGSKLALYGGTPIVQPTTSVASATRVGGGGATITDTDTFDGYTLSQIVKGLRNLAAFA